jgi:AbrB family looped-hinge helix DNA binding protein
MVNMDNPITGSSERRLTQKGQVTIPAAVRAKLGLRPHDKVAFEVSGDVAILRRAPSRLLEGFGSVPPIARPEDWSRVREDFEQGVAEEVMGEVP